MIRLENVKAIVQSTEPERDYAAALLSHIDPEQRIILVVSAQKRRTYERFKRTYKNCGVLHSFKDGEELCTSFGKYVFVELGDRNALVGRRYFDIMFEEA